MAEWDFPPESRFWPRQPPMIDGYAARDSRDAAPASWTSPLAKKSAAASFAFAVWTSKTAIAIFCGLLIAGALWFLELLATG